MFSVYGTSGQLFRGSMEQLRQIGGVGALARSGVLQPVARDGRDAESHHSLAGQSADSNFHEPLHASLLAYKQAQMTQRHPLSKVGDLMSQKVVSLPDSATVFQAWQLLAEKHVGQAPVVNAQGLLVGLMTRADLFAMSRLPIPDSHPLAWRSLMQQNVQGIMSTPVTSVTVESDIRRVAQVLLDTGLPGLPVVNEQGFVNGFISRSDILRAVVTDPPLDLWG